VKVLEDLLKLVDDVDIGPIVEILEEVVIEQAIFWWLL